MKGFAWMFIGVIWLVPAFSFSQEQIEPAESNPHETVKDKHLLSGPQIITIPGPSSEPDPPDASGMWYRAFLTFESSLDLQRQGKYLEALNKCNEAKALYDGIQFNFPEFQPDIVKFKQKVVAETRLRIIDASKGKSIVRTIPKTPPGGDPAGTIWIHAFQFFENALDLERQGKYREALTKCNEAIKLFNDLAQRFPTYQPDIVELKQKATAHTKARLLASNQSIVAGQPNGHLPTWLWVGMISISAVVIGFFLGLKRGNPETSKLLQNKPVTVSIFLLFTVTLIFGLASLYFAGLADSQLQEPKTPPPKSIPARPTFSPRNFDSTPPKTEPSEWAPKPQYPAPGPNDKPLKNTHDLVDAYLRARSWKSRLPYTYQAKQNQAQIEAYYKRWPDFSLPRFKMKLFQMELEEEFGGPFWVYQISKDDAEKGGIPLIIRVESGDLKVDWGVFSEFFDRQFVEFQNSPKKGPRRFRLVAERVSASPNPIDGYDCYEINPPYGGYRAHSQYAYVNKDSETAAVINSKIGPGDEPLAVILTLNKKELKPGTIDYEITNFVSEGWFSED